jgi:sulfatase modifying factor 1
MRFIYLSLLVFISTIVLGQKDSPMDEKQNNAKASAALSKKIKQFIKKGFPKKLNQAIGELVYIPGGTYNMGQMPYGIYNYPKSPFGDYELDTFLFAIPPIPKRVTVNSFLMGATEVTNAQYREFVIWVRDSIAHAAMGHIKKSPKGEQIDWDQALDWSEDGPLFKLFYTTDELFESKKVINIHKLIYASGNYKEDKALLVYPDTLCWIREFPYSYNDPMRRNYFSDSYFDNFPVVGVSWDQANAYCDWKTHQVNKILAKNGYPPIQLRLPIEAEWEYAALALTEDDLQEKEGRQAPDPKIYPWGSGLTDENGKYLANFGPITDESGVWIKPYIEGELEKPRFKDRVLRQTELGLFTSEVKSFPSYAGLYDMAGNVTEWVMNSPYIQRSTTTGATVESFHYTGDRPPAREPSARERMDSSEIEYPQHKDNLGYIFSEADSIEVMRYLFDQSRDDDGFGGSVEDYFMAYFPLTPKKWRDFNVIFRSGTKKRVGKGGSWAESHINIIPGAHACYTQKYGYSFVGFRVAASFDWAEE